MEYNMRNKFPDKTYTKCGGKTNPRLLSKKSKLSISLDEQSEIYKVCFYRISRSRSAKIY